MTVLELARILASVAVLLALSGAGLTLLVVRGQTARWAYLLLPFVGLAVTSAVAHVTSYAGMPAVRSLWILLAVSALLLAIAVRRGALRAPRPREWAILLAATPALVLAVWPMVAIGRLLPIGDTNCDPVSYSAAADFLAGASMREPPEVAAEHPLRVPVASFLTTPERLGFVFLAAYTNVLAGVAPEDSFSAIAGAGFALGAVGPGALAAAGLGGGAAAGVAATLLYALCAFPLWTVYGGYGAQALASGLLPVLLWIGGRAVRSDAWPDRVLAGVLASALAGVYSESLPYVAAPLAALALLEAAQRSAVAATRPSRWRPVAGLLVVGAVAFAFDPVAATRAAGRVLSVFVAPSLGNVDWSTNPGQVLGLLPFAPPAASPRGLASRLLFVPFVVLLALIAAGLLRLRRDGRELVAAFALPCAASIAYFVWSGFRYGEFKAWSLAAFLPFALAGVALAGGAGRDRGIARLGTTLALLVVVVPIALRSTQLARAMESHFAFSPALDEATGWLERIAPGDGVFLSPGKLPVVSAFWMAYALRGRPTHADVGVCYTPFGNEAYAGQPWLLRHRSSPLPRSRVSRMRVVAGNEEYELLRVPPRRRAQRAQAGAGIDATPSR